jgi:hypothetical protein
VISKANFVVEDRPFWLMWLEIRNIAKVLGRFYKPRMIPGSLCCQLTEINGIDGRNVTAERLQGKRRHLVTDISVPQGENETINIGASPLSKEENACLPSPR